MSTATLETGTWQQDPNGRPERPHAHGGDNRSGFTLIEMMAVVVIMGFMLALVIPNLGFSRASALRDQARTVAAQIELTRQLAIVTGKPHRLLVDIDTGVFSIERFGENADEEEASDAPVPKVGPRTFDLAPPVEKERDYYPLQGHFTRGDNLDPDFRFQGLETSEGWFEDGLVQIVFERDGTTDSAELVIGDDDGRLIVLEVRPLLDRVSIRDETS